MARRSKHGLRGLTGGSSRSNRTGHTRRAYGADRSDPTGRAYGANRSDPTCRARRAYGANRTSRSRITFLSLCIPGNACFISFARLGRRDETNDFAFISIAIEPDARGVHPCGRNLRLSGRLSRDNNGQSGHAQVSR